MTDATRPTTSFTIREGRPDDVAAIAQLHVDTFIETHGGDAPPTFELRELQWRQQFQSDDNRWFCFVVEDSAGQLVGFAKGTLRDESVPGFQGNLNKIYLLRRYHHIGLGRQLLGHVARRFLEQGITSMFLFGEADNPTNRFYEAFEGERIGSGPDFQGTYGWRDLDRLAALCLGD